MHEMTACSVKNSKVVGKVYTEVIRKTNENLPFTAEDVRLKLKARELLITDNTKIQVLNMDKGFKNSYKSSESK